MTANIRLLGLFLNHNYSSVTQSEQIEVIYLLFSFKGNKKFFLMVIKKSGNFKEIGTRFKGKEK